MADADNDRLQTASPPAPPAGPDPHHLTNQNAEADRILSDRIGLTAKIAAAAAEGKTPRQLQDELADRLSFLPEDQRADFVVNVRSTLGFPSEGTVEINPDLGAGSDARTAEASRPAPTSAGERGAPAPVETPADAAREPGISPAEHIEQLQAELRNGALLPDDERAQIQGELDLAIAANQNRSPPARTAEETAPDRGGPEDRRSSLVGGGRQPSSPEPDRASEQATRPVAASPRPIEIQPAQTAAAPSSAAPEPTAAPKLGAVPTAAPPETPSATDENASQSGSRATAAEKQRARAPYAFYGPGAALGGLLASLRRPKPDEDVKTDAQQTEDVRSDNQQANLVAKSANFEETRMNPRRDAATLDAVRETGQQALKSHKVLENLEMAQVLNRINDAAKLVSMNEVLAEMRPGGKYANLREEFTTALKDSDSRNAYDKATGDLEIYADQRAEISEILKARPEARKPFDDLDGEIAKKFLSLPGKNDGNSAIDEAADKVKEVLEKAINAVRAALGRASQTATARLSPGPGARP
ncbi:conserved hypothetical protein [Methylocella tundrae]|uniref:Uncharacterized protein n=1 Tax=Methylocella tundrae TaxID=227605 RepID=A0A8B6M360_METTU|nr:hypothetical protein [Methylocella tundrae]VTZ48803.1 conserved hypothetical protein [Methylocella tundrae]